MLYNSDLYTMINNRFITKIIKSYAVLWNEQYHNTKSFRQHFDLCLGNIILCGSLHIRFKQDQILTTFDVNSS